MGLPSASRRVRRRGSWVSSTSRWAWTGRSSRTRSNHPQPQARPIGPDHAGSQEASSAIRDRTLDPEFSVRTARRCREDGDRTVECLARRENDLGARDRLAIRIDHEPLDRGACSDLPDHEYRPHESRDEHRHASFAQRRHRAHRAFPGKVPISSWILQAS